MIKFSEAIFDGRASTELHEPNSHKSHFRERIISSLGNSREEKRVAKNTEGWRPGFILMLIRDNREGRTLKRLWAFGPWKLSLVFRTRPSLWPEPGIRDPEILQFSHRKVPCVPPPRAWFVFAESCRVEITNATSSSSYFFLRTCVYI